MKKEERIPIDLWLITPDGKEKNIEAAIMIDPELYLVRASMVRGLAWFIEHWLKCNHPDDAELFNPLCIVARGYFHGFGYVSVNGLGEEVTDQK